MNDTYEKTMIDNNNCDPSLNIMEQELRIKPVNNLSISNNNHLGISNTNSNSNRNNLNSTQSGPR